MVNNLLIYFAAVLRAGKADSLAAAFAKLVDWRLEKISTLNRIRFQALCSYKIRQHSGLDVAMPQMIAILP